MGRPSRLNTSEFPRLVPVDVMPSVTVLGWTLVHGYGGLVRKIQNDFEDVRIDVSRPGQAPRLDADLVLFPYDFRLGVRDAAERLKSDIDTRLGGLTAPARQRRVIVVAHSMGGLVARYWLGPLAGAADCRALVTLSTPHRGSPKALDWLVNGVGVGRLRLPGSADTLQEWPSIYDLLPCYRAVLPREKTHEETGAAGERMDDALYPHELTAVARLSVERAAESYAMHQEIGGAWSALADAGQAPQVTALYSRGHATPARATLDGTRLRVVKTPVPGWLPNADWEGDGTVPANSAIPLELDDERRAWEAVPERHQPMAETPTVIKILKDYAGASMAAMRGAQRPERPWLGLGVDDLALAGDPIPVTAKLFGADVGEDTAGWVTVRPVGGRPALPPFPMPYDGGSWHAEIPALAPGAYEFAVELVGVPEMDRVRGGDEVGVVEL